MENVSAQGFQPLEAFIRLIGGDLKSLRHMSAQALRRGLVFRLTQGVIWSILVALAGLWIYCFVAVTNTPAADAAKWTHPVGAHIAIWTHICVMGFCASAAALCAAYCVRVLWSQSKQNRAQERVQLKVVGAEFRRDDWIDLMNELPDGDTIYRAMFEAAPMAHYEKLRSPAPA
jgi:hypothetical protein